MLTKGDLDINIDTELEVLLDSNDDLKVITTEIGKIAARMYYDSKDIIKYAEASQEFGKELKSGGQLGNRVIAEQDGIDLSGLPPPPTPTEESLTLLADTDPWADLDDATLDLLPDDPADNADPNFTPITIDDVPPDNLLAPTKPLEDAIKNEEPIKPGGGNFDGSAKPFGFGLKTSVLPPATQDKLEGMFQEPVTSGSNMAR